jgi:fluoroacetyl-CoA thioesterase
MTMAIEPGLVGELTHTVTEADTAAAYGSGLVPVLSTPHLIALMESAAQAAIAPYLDEASTAVGTRVDMGHLAATPVGMRVRVRAELLEVDRRRLRFHVEAWDEIEKVGEADHERFIVDRARFLTRVEEKVDKLVHGD